ncbi:MAG: cory-CC-star protein [Actinomycetaceae bacterium]|nr:cory-CC-star protein [Actinomycetaceae bacterium]
MSDRETNAGRAQTFRARLADIGRGFEEFYARPFAQPIARDKQDEDDFFMLVVLGEALGIPDPAAYYNAELLPFLFDDFHKWHRRAGMPRSPLDHISCC